MRGQDLSSLTRHHLCVGAHIRRSPTLVVFWLLFLPADPFHNYLLASDRAENPKGGEGVHEGKQEANSAGKSDELYGGGADHFIRVLHHSRKHLQHRHCLYVYGGVPADYGPPAPHQSISVVL